MKILYQILEAEEAKNFCFEIQELEGEIQLQQSEPSTPDDWCQLSYQQCKHCPLDSSNKYCPVALKLSGLLTKTELVRSYEQVTVRYINEHKHILTLKADAQSLLTTMAGLLIAGTSNCSHTRFMWPMARFHRPFSGLDESVNKAMANLSSLYIRSRTEMNFTDWALRYYQNITIVNLALIKRLRADVEATEPLVNALTNLDLFSKEIIFNLNNNMSGIAHIYNPVGER